MDFPLSSPSHIPYQGQRAPGTQYSAPVSFSSLLFFLIKHHCKDKVRKQEATGEKERYPFCFFPPSLGSCLKCSAPSNPHPILHRALLSMARGFDGLHCPSLNPVCLSSSSVLCNLYASVKLLLIKVPLFYSVTKVSCRCDIALFNLSCPENSSHCGRLLGNMCT